VRIIAATHRDLPQLVRDGRFREDLYYRLHVVSLTLPPLRSRRQDLPLLIDDLLRRLAQRHDRGPVAVDPEAQTLLLSYDWPGNVRELLNVLERALVLASQDVIGPEHLPAEIRQQDGTHGGATAQDSAGQEEPAALLSLADVERQHVLRVLRAMDGSRERTARVLGISRRTLTRMLQRWRPDLPPE
jgi:DNA-binding NtrC family response regulator